MQWRLALTLMTRLRVGLSVSMKNATSVAFRLGSTDMKFVCYTCGFVFHHGIPPVEALSTEQAPAAGPIHEHNNRFTILEGTRFEGMSTYNFCSFCLVVITDFPSAWVAGNTNEERKEHKALAELALPNDGGYGIHCYTNRLGILTRAKKAYPNGDFDILESLAMDGIK